MVTEETLENKLPKTPVDNSRQYSTSALANKPVLPNQKSIYVDIPTQKQANSTYAKYQGKLCYWCDETFAGPVPIVPIVIPCEW